MDILCFWGKAQPRAGGVTRVHPAVYHLLDVAAVMEAIVIARPLVTSRLSRLLGLTSVQVRELVVVFAALHDLGKFTPVFQAKAPEFWPASVLRTRDRSRGTGNHTADGLTLWRRELAHHLGDRLWPAGAAALDVLAPAVFGHHGRPVAEASFLPLAEDLFSEPGLRAALAASDAVLGLLMAAPIDADSPPHADVRTASWLVSGLITLADWIGSSQHWFPYTAPLHEDPTFGNYLNDIARDRAQRAVREAGVVPTPSAPLRSFVELTAIKTPSPAQSWAESLALPDGPVLVIIEDATGSGKTEAAQMLVHRLMAAGRATGAYWAMPTQATANAMYDRQITAIARLFAVTDQLPSLVLAHGQVKLHAGFRKTVLPHVGDQCEGNAGGLGADAELPSSVACAAFLAESHRAALMADVGAGTVDQALLAALPSRFNALRLLGLGEKVLIVDEAHAYDAYMHAELSRLLEFQALLGGSAVVLSATLPQKKRAELVATWRRSTSSEPLRSGLSWGVSAVRAAAPRLVSEAYPLGTVASRSSAVREEPFEAASWSVRDLPVRFVHGVDDVLRHVAESCQRGAATVWIRNTVDDCLHAATALRKQGIEPLVFHARFAQCDRQAREKEVMTLFGESSTPAERRGRALVATQVVEQSLDLDFDVMVSDVAPVDLLIQRAGRLWRHRRARPFALTCEELVVLAPQPTADPPADWLADPFKGTAFIYNAGVLWRTVQALAATPVLATPGNIRSLIEQVYASDFAPEALVRSADAATTREKVNASMGVVAALDPASGYSGHAKGFVDDVLARTRLGEDDVRVRMARLTADGTLEPWAPWTNRALWEAWALSDIRLSARRVHPCASHDPAHDTVVHEARATWGKFEQEMPVLVLALGPNGRWSGSFSGRDRRTYVEYEAVDGLRYIADSKS